MKYFILGSFASAIFLYGIALTYGAIGSVNLSNISAFLSVNVLIDDGLLMAGMALLGVGFAFKVAAVPFHQWTPDVYEGSPSPVVAFMAVVAKAGAFAAFLRFFGSTLFVMKEDWQPIILGLAVLSLLIGSTVALAQRNVKRMLAYSSISHAGFILLGLQAATVEGISGSLFYLLAYTFLVMGSFAIVTIVGGDDDSNHSLDAYRGLGRSQPLLAFAFAVLLFASAGLPLTSGFLAKFSVISALIDNGSYVTAVFAMLMAAVAAAFYLRLVVLMYASDADDTRAPKLVIPGAVTAVLVVAVGFTIILGIAPKDILDGIGFARTATADLFAPTASPPTP